MNQAIISEITEVLKTHQLDGLLVSNPVNIAYLTGVTHFSKEEREAFVLLTTQKTYLFTDSRYTGGLKLGDVLTIIECSARSSFYDGFAKLVEKQNIQTIGFENTNLTVSEFEKLKDTLKNTSKLQTAPFILERQRVIKTPEEIEKLQKACQLTDQAFTHVLTSIKKGVTEQQLAAELEYFMRKNGGEVAFPSIVAFGANAAIPHHNTGPTKLTKLGTPILFDIGARFAGYNADMTRTVFFGKPSTQVEQQYKAVHFTQTKALEQLQKSMQKSHEAAASEVAKSAEEALHKTGFPSLPHGLGHGVGLEVHESPTVYPRSKDLLKPGMTLTIEPGIYLLGKSGVRIEDTVLLTKNDIQLLTHAPKSIIIL